MIFVSEAIGRRSRSFLATSTVPESASMAT
jgi:hypothetical protein